MPPDDAQVNHHRAQTQRKYDCAPLRHREVRLRQFAVQTELQAKLSVRRLRRAAQPSEPQLEPQNKDQPHVVAEPRQAAAHKLFPKRFIRDIGRGRRSRL